MDTCATSLYTKSNNYSNRLRNKGKGYGHWIMVAHCALIFIVVCQLSWSYSDKAVDSDEYPSLSFSATTKQLKKDKKDINMANKKKENDEREAKDQAEKAAKEKTKKEQEKIEGCPNNDFEYYHMCIHCTTREQAMDFLKDEARRIAENFAIEHGDDYSFQTTVFSYLDNKDYTPSAIENLRGQTERTCLINRKVQTWKCQGTSSAHGNIVQWYNCENRGLCSGHHALSNGHFFSHTLEC